MDDTLAIARELGDIVISRPCQGGAARARNDGAEIAAGDVLFFVDSDVTVNPAAVAGILAPIQAGEADAVFGAYQPIPPPEVRTTATIYKNLMHHYTHLQGAGPAETFWSGFSAVRRDLFEQVGGFDPAATTTADVEDIHLGYRLRQAGCRIVLDPSLQVLHHKAYTVWGVISSDVLHRAIPWTRAMLQFRHFGSDLNLQTSSILAALVSLVLPLVLVSAVWLGPGALLVAAALVAFWTWQHRALLGYFRRQWTVGGMVASAAMLYLYYLYSVVGAAMGTAAFALRHERDPRLNWLSVRFEDGPIPDLLATVAVIVSEGERAVALDHLPAVDSSWELIVVAPEAPANLPASARFIPAPAGASRCEMRHLALLVAGGEMFAMLDGHCRPGADWLGHVKRAAPTSLLAIAGSFREDRPGVRRRAEHTVRYWQWRPQRSAGWVVHHPANNLAVRSELARRLGGFRVEGALIVRLAGFGARPVKFDPAMTVSLTEDEALRDFLRGVAGVARLRASATARYFDMSRSHRVVMILSSPLTAAVAGLRTIREARREGTLDRGLVLALPLILTGWACHWGGRDIGLLRPARSGGKVPRSLRAIEALPDEAIPVASRR